MAPSPKLSSSATCIVRLAAPEIDQLSEIVFSRYPQREWACFARFGWRETADGLIVTLAALDVPKEGELDPSVEHVAISEPYTLRTALAAERHRLGVGVIHSHPEGCRPDPSIIDDDMDSYFSQYFIDFAPDRPYVSLILSKLNGEVAASGRVHWQTQWRRAKRVIIEKRPTVVWGPAARLDNSRSTERHARLVGAFGPEAAQRLRASSVGVIGAGGTGSAAIEVLARAGVGRIVIVDPDHIETSNLERVHGSRPDHAAMRALKVAVATDHVRGIDPDCSVVPIAGSLPQKEVIDELVTVDLVLGCTDSHHSRLALSDLAVRYLVPAIDCGVTLEGRNGRITGQIAQFVRFLAADSCALCRRMVRPEMLTQELMPGWERRRRREAADNARQRGDNPGAYWHTEQQLNTVGYHTTMAGSIVAGYAIGWITGRFDMPFSCIQMNLVAPLLEVVECDREPRNDCSCRRIRGWADQASADALITAPAHWEAPKVGSSGSPSS